MGRCTCWRCSGTIRRSWSWWICPPPYRWSWRPWAGTFSSTTATWTFIRRSRPRPPSGDGTRMAVARTSTWRRRRDRVSRSRSPTSSDCSQPGRGNMMVIPGSHHQDTLRRPQDGVIHTPPGAQSVLARPGDALAFDRRLWHSRSHNGSSHTRVAIFCAYTYRWIRPRGEYPLLLAGADLPPCRRQLLGGAVSALGHWQPEAADVPLRTTSAGD
jgi:hypothetical protein